MNRIKARELVTTLMNRSILDGFNVDYGYDNEPLGTAYVHALSSDMRIMAYFQEQKCGGYEVNMTVTNIQSVDWHKPRWTMRTNNAMEVMQGIERALAENMALRLKRENK